MNKNITEIYNFIQDISWYFGNQGFNGECCGDLSLIEFMALKKINEKNNCPIQEIANSLNISKSGASKIIDRLENRKYVRRVQSSVDGRVCCIEISEKGMDTISRIFEKYTDYVSAILNDLNPKSIDDIRNVLAMLTASIQKQGFIKSNQTEVGGESC